jgi:hypothetical protein
VKLGDNSCALKIVHAAYMMEINVFYKKGRRVELAKGRTGRLTKTLKMVKSAYVNVVSSLVAGFQDGLVCYYV